jgi:hypothetical protein
MDIKFIANEPALLIGKTLIIADLHIGIEYEFYMAGIKIPLQIEKIKLKIDNILAKTKVNKLIVLGDVKHKVPGISYQEMKDIPNFLNYFTKKLEVVCVLGNHDSNLNDFVSPDVKIQSSSGFLLGDFYLNHGHAWPHADFLKAKHIITAHTHPQIEFRDKLGYRWIEPVWIKAKLNPKKIQEKYKQEIKKLPELIIMPAFNEFAGGIAVNRNYPDKKGFLGPIIKSANLKKAKIYLVDGTFLGELGRLYFL